jgi:hypothetical protein
MELPTNPTLTATPTPSPSQIRSEQVWQALSPTQQQLVFRTLVHVCRSLVTVPPSPARDGEEHHEPG